MLNDALTIVYNNLNDIIDAYKVIAPDKNLDDYAVIKVTRSPLMHWSMNKGSISVLDIDIIVYCKSNVDDLQTYVDNIEERFIQKNFDDVYISLGNIKLQSDFMNYSETDKSWMCNILLQATANNK